MSIAVINQFAEDRANDEKYTFENGLTILEGLSATGLRSIRYAKEIPRSSLILANDFSKRAVETITNNIEKNEVGNIVKPSHGDASAVMSKYKGYEERFVVVDLDPVRFCYYNFRNKLLILHFFSSVRISYTIFRFGSTMCSRRRITLCDLHSTYLFHTCDEFTNLFKFHFIRTWLCSVETRLKLAIPNMEACLLEEKIAMKLHSV